MSLRASIKGGLVTANLLAPALREEYKGQIDSDIKNKDKLYIAYEEDNIDAFKLYRELITKQEKEMNALRTKQEKEMNALRTKQEKEMKAVRTKQEEMKALRTKQKEEMNSLINSITWNVRVEDSTKDYKLIQIKGIVHSAVLDPDGKTTRAIKSYFIIEQK